MFSVSNYFFQMKLSCPNFISEVRESMSFTGCRYLFSVFPDFIAKLGTNVSKPPCMREVTIKSMISNRTGTDDAVSCQHPLLRDSSATYKYMLTP